MSDKIVTVRLPGELGEAVTRIVTGGRYLNPTEFVRAAVREKVEREEAKA
jgi:Arc/MetJ-type ribon-helix-helix transcriptional regulator